jgi:hypothetical protein
MTHNIVRPSAEIGKLVAGFPAAAFALLATPAAAQTIHTVTGANPPAQYSVCAGDTLVLRKQMGRELLKDGSRAPGWLAWNDRSRSNTVGNGFEMIGATKLRFIENVQGKGWVYAPIDAKACPAAAPAVAAVATPPASPTRPAPLASPVTPAQPSPPQLFGVNLSGCEFGAGTALCPTTADIDTYIAKGFTLIRLPVHDQHLRGDNLTKIVALVAYAQSKGAQVILDRHDYTRHSAAEAWAFWRNVVPSFSSKTMIELANEPVKGYPSGSNPWMVSAQDTKETVALFRANGVKNPILYGSPGYSATFRFVKFKGAKFPAEGMGDAIDRVGGIGDPLNKTFFSGHRYLDSGSSGSKSGCKDTGDAGISEWAAAMRKRGIKGYMTEFAFARHDGIPASCQAVGTAMMAAVKANSDVILGTTAWGGGRAWSESYIFKIEPAKGTFRAAQDSPYLTMLTGR